MYDFIKVLEAKIGKKEAEQAKEVLQAVLSERKQQ
jgi:hypothetical protein